MISAHEDSYDLVSIEVHHNDGRQIAGCLVALDIGGRPHRVPFRMTPGASRPTYHDVVDLPSDLVIWLDRFAGEEALELVQEELKDRREALKNSDTGGKLIGWFVKGGAS